MPTSLSLSLSLSLDLSPFLSPSLSLSLSASSLLASLSLSLSLDLSPVVQHEQLQIAPPPKPRELAPDELRKMDRQRSSVLRELRMFLRDATNKLLAERKFKEFIRPVDSEEVSLFTVHTVYVHVYTCHNTECFVVCTTHPRQSLFLGKVTASGGTRRVCTCVYLSQH